MKLLSSALKNDISQQAPRQLRMIALGPASYKNVLVHD